MSTVDPADVPGRGGLSAVVPTDGRFSLKPLMFQTFVCTMATMTFTALAGPIGRTLDLAPWQMGLAVTAGAVSWIFTAQAWGRASDRHGRRPVLLGGLGGFAVAYGGLCLVAALALKGGMSALAAFVGLLVGRTLTGAFFAAIPTASAAMVADHVEPERRAAAMGALGMASAAAMVIGPALAGLIAPYDLDLPLLAAAALPLVALAASWRLLPPGRPHAPLVMQPPRLTDRRLRQPVIVAFASMLAVSTAQMVIGFYAIDRLALSPQNGAHVAGIALTCAGAALILAQGMVRFFNWRPIVLIRLGALIGGLGFLAVAVATAPILLYLCYFVAAFGMGVLWPSISALAANAVHRHEQGAAAGAVTAAQGLGSVLGPLLGTLIYAVDITAPYVMIALLLMTLVPQSETIPARADGKGGDGQGDPRPQSSEA